MYFYPQGLTMKKEPRNITNRQVVAQSNNILGARYELTETEQKIILLAIAQVDSINDDEFFIYSVTVPELEKLLGVELKQQQLKETCRRLLQRVVTIHTQSGWRMFQWINRAEYFNGENRIEFKISDDIKPYLLNLKGNFTKLQLENAIKFSGKYTIRFYQFLMKLKNTTERKERYELDDLYKMLMLPKSMQVFGQFKRNVLDPSIKEINEKSEIKASYELGRTGRKYTDLILSWEYKAKSQNQTKKARATKDFDKYIGKLVEYQGRIIEIDQVRETTEQETGDIRKICVIYNARQNISRVDFENIDHLEINIKRAEKMLKENPDLGAKYDKSREIAELFAKLDDFNQKIRI